MPGGKKELPVSTCIASEVPLAGDIDPDGLAHVEGEHE